LPTIAFKASTQSQRQHLAHASVATNMASADLLNSSECLGGDALLKYLKNYCRNANIKTSIHVGVIGYPNVGKSSLINSLRRSKVCGVSATPGFTKTIQEIHLDKHIKLIDCPGIVFSTGQNDIQVLLRNCVKVNQLSDPMGAVDLILKRCRKEDLMNLYNTPEFDNVSSFLTHLAKLRGKLKKGGVADIETMAKIVLQDWCMGKLSFHTMPPLINETHKVSSTIVREWSREFNLDDTKDLEAATLDSLGSQSINHGCIIVETDAHLDIAMDDLVIDDTTYPNNAREQDMILEDEAVTSHISPASVVNLMTKKLSSKKITMVHNSHLNEEEASLNPQINRQRKKLQKQVQRDKKRAERVEQDVNMDDNYNFATDFVPIQPNNSMTMPISDNDEKW
jgi:nuclear GTP-binding protein